MIKTIKLTKKYDDMYAIRDIDLDLGQGDLFGFIGPNGAGKTTTMRIIATLLEPTEGEAYVCDYSIYTHPKEIRRLVGYMPDFFGLYDDMTVIEYLEFLLLLIGSDLRCVASGATRCLRSSTWTSSGMLMRTRYPGARLNGLV